MKEYALYQGDKIKSIGTLDEIQEETGLRRKTLFFYKTPAYKKRIKELNYRTYTELIELEGEIE